MSKNILNFLGDREWDKPFFKILANNDTGAAAGHQGGVVIPITLRPYFPDLDESVTSSESPTTDRFLKVSLYSGTMFLGEVVTRYQFQTWGGTRSAESRLTDNLSTLRNLAVGNDVLIMQRRMDQLDQYRIVLIKRKRPDFTEIESLLAGRRWGSLEITYPPVTQQEIETAKQDIFTTTTSPFEVVVPEVKRVIVTSNRAARNIVFRRLVKSQYSFRCAISGLAIQTPKQAFEVEAAHVVPLPSGGSDDVRNGLALSQTVHWAFDCGLIGIDPIHRRVHVPKGSRIISDNKFLLEMQGRHLTEAMSSDYRVHKDALEWHWENVVRKWE
jgi:putative restriction endonuclease